MRGGAGAEAATAPPGSLEASEIADLVDVREQLDPQARPFGDVPVAADDRIARGSTAVLGRRMLVVGERAAVAQRAQVVRRSCCPGVWKLR